MYIIGEVLLLVNIFLNSLLLFATARILSLPCKLYRVGAAASLGSLAVFIPSIPGAAILKLFVSVLMLLMAFGKQKYRNFLVTLLIFFGLSFIMGGSIIGLVFMLDGGISSNILIPGNLPIGYLLLSFVIIFTVILGIRYLERKTKIKKLSVPVKLVVNGKTVELNALVDTGNQLQTFTGEYCLVVEARVLHSVLTPEDRQLLSQMGGYENIDTGNLNGEAHKRFFPLWFNSLGTNHGVLLAFRPEKLALGYSEIIENTEIKGDRDPWQEVSALIAVTFQELNIDDHNCGLVPAELLKFAGG